MRITTVFIAAFLCMMVLAVAGCHRAERLSRISEDDSAGEAMEQDTAADAGEQADVPCEIPVYPGASKIGSYREISVTGMRIEGTIEGNTYHVNTDYDEVAAWYRGELAGEIELSATISGERGSGRGTVFVLLSGSGIGAAVTVAAADDGPGTTINIGSWQGSVRETW